MVSSSIGYFDDLECVHCPQKVISRAFIQGHEGFGLESWNSELEIRDLDFGFCEYVSSSSLSYFDDCESVHM